MTDEEMLNASYDMLYLAKCAVFEEPADLSKLKSDLRTVYKLSKYHGVCALCSYALDGVLDKSDEIYRSFLEGRERSVSRSVMYDIERGGLETEFEKHEIRYMPLKGIIIKELYPKLGMREMADNDLWYDLSKQKEVVSVFKSKEYDIESVGKYYHDVFVKEPIFNFQMHTVLYDERHEDGWSKYFEERTKHLTPEPDKKFCMRFSDDDFYVYIVSHEYKHYSNVGIGLRSFADMYLIQKHLGKGLNREYIAAELAKLGISEFETDLASLALKAFSKTPDLSDISYLSKDEKEKLDSFMLSATERTLDNVVEKKLAKFGDGEEKITAKTKLKYLKTRMFPNREFMKKYFGAKYAVMLPFCHVYRWITLGVPNIKPILKELFALSKADGDKSKKT